MWAEETATTTTFDFENDSQPFVTAPGAGGVTRISLKVSTPSDWNSNALQLLSASNAGNGSAAAKYDFSELVKQASKVKVEFDCYLGNVNTGMFSIGDASTRNVAGAKGNNGYDNTGTIWSLGINRGSSRNNIRVSGKDLGTSYNSYLTQWLHAEVLVDVVNKTVTYSVKAITEDKVIASGTDVAYYTSAQNCSQIDFYQSTGNCSYYLDNLKITSFVDQSATYKDYKVNYLFSDNESNINIKDSKTYNALAGSVASISEEDKVAIWYNGEKYIYESDNASSVTVSDNAEVNVYFRKAAIYNYTVNATDENNSVLNQIATGTVFEGESSRVYYNKAFLSDGKWYMTDGNKSYPTYAIDADKDATFNVVYNKANIAYFAECENLSKSASNAIAATGAYPERYSGSKVARLYKNSYIYTPAFETTKTYTLYLWGRNNASSSVANVTLGLRDTDGVVTDLENAFTDWTAGQSELKSIADITIPAGSSLVLRNSIANYNSNLEMDYIYLVEQLPATIPASISAAQYATYIPSYNVVAPADVKAYTVKVNTEKNGIELSEIAEGAVIKAGTPILLNAAEGSYDFAVSADDAADIADNDLVAATADVIATGNEYALAKKNGVVGFAPVKKDVVIPAGKAYLQVDNADAAAKFFSLGGDATGINTIGATNKTNDAYYTLQGVKTTKPAAKGVYILNGKKVVVNK